MPNLPQLVDEGPPPAQPKDGKCYPLHSGRMTAPIAQKQQIAWKAAVGTPANTAQTLSSLAQATGRCTLTMCSGQIALQTVMEAINKVIKEYPMPESTKEALKSIKDFTKRSAEAGIKALD
jgi:hypothetical protein